MNNIKTYTMVMVVLLLIVFFGGLDRAWAHRVNVFAWVEGDTVHVQSKFSGGRKVKDGKIDVLDPQGIALLSGLTNDQGEFSFVVPQQTDLRILLSAGQGHQGEWTLRAAELGAGPSKNALQTGAEKDMPSEPKGQGLQTVPDAPIAVQDNALTSKELEAALETVLDRKLKPIAGMLADIRQSGPTVKDIFAGIGYILGLVGVGAYVHSRKKRG